MTAILTLFAAIIIVSVISSKLLYRMGVPTLLIFLGLGMLCGSDCLNIIYFDNYGVAKDICSAALIFIMFYGGFGTNIKIAKPVVADSVLMASVGVVLTALITGVFCMLILHISFIEGLLIGSVISSTDAASVFSILRAKKLNLKGGLASLLEIESGSNDPFAYMLTLICVTVICGETGGTPIPIMLLKQIGFGIAVGFILASITAWVLKKIDFEVDGLYSLLILGIAICSYTLCEFIGGNGYLSVYICGIILGNSKMLHKRNLVHFFDGISWLSQIILFFALGLLAFPTQFVAKLPYGIAIALFLLFIARPITCAVLLTPFKIDFKKQMFISWSGLRGAASIVFAIYAMTGGEHLNCDIFNIVFIVAMFSVAVQGTLLPKVAEKLDLVDNETTVLKTFTDYREEINTSLMEYIVDKDSSWCGKSIMNANIPEEILVVMIKRKNDVIIPKGSTVIEDGDTMVLSSSSEEAFDLIAT